MEALCRALRSARWAAGQGARLRHRRSSVSRSRWPPHRWVPSSAREVTVAAPVPIHQLLTHKFTRGHPRPLLAIVHHRMVGTLASTDTTFTTGERVASTHFGIGLCSKHGGHRAVCIHQYVRLGDQAWGNGNNHFPEGHAKEGEPVPSKWNERHPKRLVNSRTISIEHQDNGRKGHPRRGSCPTRSSRPRSGSTSSCSWAAPRR